MPTPLVENEPGQIDAVFRPTPRHLCFCHLGSHKAVVAFTLMLRFNPAVLRLAGGLCCLQTSSLAWKVSRWLRFGVCINSAHLSLAKARTLWFRVHLPRPFHHFAMSLRLARSLDLSICLHKASLTRPFHLETTPSLPRICRCLAKRCHRRQLLLWFFFVTRSHHPVPLSIPKAKIRSITCHLRSLSTLLAQRLCCATCICLLLAYLPWSLEALGGATFGTNHRGFFSRHTTLQRLLGWPLCDLRSNFRLGLGHVPVDVSRSQRLFFCHFHFPTPTTVWLSK